MTRTSELIEQFEISKRELEFSAEFLEESYRKVQGFNLDGLRREQYESLEALSARFARTSDILTKKVFKTIARLADHETLTIMDTLNFAEKLNLVANAREFRELRELRNQISHEYFSGDVRKLAIEVLQYTPILLDAVKKTLAYEP